MFNTLINTNSGLDLAHIASLADEMRSYHFGEVAVFHGKGESESSLLIATHTDKASFVCTELCTNGTAKASLIGNLSTRSAANSFVVSEKGILAALTVSGSDESPIFSLDFGTEDLSETKKLVSVGDVFRPENTVRRLSDTVASGAGLSVSAPTLTLVRLCEALANDAPSSTVYVAFLKEGCHDFGPYSPVTIAFKPSSAVCVGAVDVDDAPTVKLGMGGAVRVSDRRFGSDKIISDALIEAGGVPAVLTKGSCAAANVQAVGVPASELDIPVKNLATHTEIIDLGDICQAAEILKRFCK